MLGISAKRWKINSIVLCVDKGIYINMEKFIEEHVDVEGAIHVYGEGNKIYMGFKTKSTVNEIEKMFSTKVYNVINNVIFLK